MFSRPLRHRILTGPQHLALFQNVEKVRLAECLQAKLLYLRVRLWLRGRVADLQSGDCRFESRPGLLRTKVYSAFHPSGVGK